MTGRHKTLEFYILPAYNIVVKIGGMGLKTEKIQGISVNYYDKGMGGVVLFLHGWGADAPLYSPILEHLAAKFRVIAPDLPGFGASGEPDSPWCTDDYVDFILQFLEKLGVGECVPIGHSHGGRVILNWLSREKQPITVKKCVLCGAAGLKPRRGAGYYIKVYSYKTLKILLKPFPKLLERLRRNSGSADYRAASPVMRGTLTRVLSEDYEERLSNISADTLLIWGESDTASPVEHGRVMEHVIPDAGLVVMKGCGHFALLEQHAHFCRILDAFL